MRKPFEEIFAERGSGANREFSPKITIVIENRVIRKGKGLRPSLECFGTSLGELVGETLEVEPLPAEKVVNGVRLPHEYGMLEVRGL